MDDIHARIFAALKAHDAMLREEQAVRGLDGMDELAVQELLAAALSRDGFGVFREVPYPMAAMASPAMLARRSAANARGKSSRERCDIVLTPAPHVGVRDEVWPPPDASREKPTTAEAQLSLFATREADDAVAQAKLREPTRRNMSDASVMPQLVQPFEACWLELKVVGQFTIIDGFAQPNSGYASLLTAACASDIKKLSSLGHLARWSTTGLQAPSAASVLVLFTVDAAAADHDVPVALHRAMDRGAIFRAPIVGQFAIPDRVGNACCTIAVIASVPEV